MVISTVTTTTTTTTTMTVVSSFPCVIISFCYKYAVKEEIDDDKEEIVDDNHDHHDHDNDDNDNDHDICLWLPPAISAEELEPLALLLAKEKDVQCQFPHTKYQQLAKDVAAKDMVLLNQLPEATQQDFLKVII